VDGDACPVRREVERAARHFAVPVRYFSHPTQIRIGSPDTSHRTVEGPDAVDFAIVAACRDGDVVVTDDLGLAAMVVSRGAVALSSRGRRFAPHEMTARLHVRHLARKARRAGRRTHGPKPFTAADRRRFETVLSGIIREMSGPQRRRETPA